MSKFSFFSFAVFLSKISKIFQYFGKWILSHPIRVFFLVIIGGIVGWQVSLMPQVEKNWRAENAFLPEILQEDDTFTVSFLRDFYTPENNPEKEMIRKWRVNTYKFSDLEEISLGVSHFADFYGAAHTFLRFRFADGVNLNVSFEARLEEGESYSPWKGLVRQNELYLALGTDRDIIGERVNRKNEEVFLYPLDISSQKQQEVLLSVLSRVNALHNHPEFYNTLTDNCTTSLVDIAEGVQHKNILWGYSHLLPGYFDEKLFTMGLLKNPENFSESDFPKFKELHHQQKGIEY